MSVTGLQNDTTFHRFGAMRQEQPSRVTPVGSSRVVCAGTDYVVDFRVVHIRDINGYRLPFGIQERGIAGAWSYQR